MDRFEENKDQFLKFEPYRTLEIISGGQVEQSNSCEDEFIKAQTTPNCCWKSLKIALRDHMNCRKEYKRLCLKIKEWCLERYKGRISSSVRQDDFGNFALEHARVSLEKRLKKQKLERLPVSTSCLQDQLEDVVSA